MADLPGLGEFEAPSAAGRAAGALGYIATLVVAAGLERLQFKMRATESAHWWASNGRDAVNAGAMLAMSVGLSAMGFSLPVAFCLAAVVMLGLSLVQMVMDEERRMIDEGTLQSDFVFLVARA